MHWYVERLLAKDVPSELAEKVARKHKGNVLQTWACVCFLWTLRHADLDPFACQCIQICRQHRNKRLPFSSAHLGNLTVVQDHATNQLHVKRPQAKHTLGSFSHYLHHHRAAVLTTLLLFCGC